MSIRGSFDVVTGAFGYVGKYIAQHLLERGRSVKTLTAHPTRPNPFGDRIEVAGLDFDDPGRLTESLRGAAVLYNTYWIRFPYAGITFDQAVATTYILIRAARQAGVGRFVHISVTNPSEDSPFGYFRGKALLERAVIESGLSHAIVRPTVVFGKEDILINNIAWLLRKSPVFAVPGPGRYRLQPVFVEDLAEIAVSAGEGTNNVVLDAVGPEVFTFDDLLRQIADAVDSRAYLVHLPSTVAVAVARTIGWFLGDVPLTQQEAGALMANLLISDGPPTGKTCFTHWLKANANGLGRAYASELARHYR